MFPHESYLLIHEVCQGVPTKRVTPSLSELWRHLLLYQILQLIHSTSF